MRTGRPVVSLALLLVAASAVSAQDRKGELAKLAQKIEAEVRDHGTDAAKAAREKAHQKTEALANAYMVERNAFNVQRGLKGYTELLGMRFANDVKTWNKDMRILDGGAGKANFFREILEGKLAADDAPRSVPDLVAVSASRPGDEDLQDARKKFRDRFLYPEGKLGEPGHAFEKSLGLGTFDRIVESFGASHYAPIDQVIESYGLLLKEGGKLFFHVGNRTTFYDEEGKVMSARTYLSSIEGFKLVGYRIGSQIAVELVRTGDPLVVPWLGETIKSSDAPPKRVYVVGGQTTTTALPEPETFPTYQIDTVDKTKIAGLVTTSYHDAAGSVHQIHFYTDAAGKTHVSLEPPELKDTYLLVFGGEVYRPPEGAEAWKLKLVPETTTTTSGAGLETVVVQNVRIPERGFARAMTEGFLRLVGRATDRAHPEGDARER
jgi:hypothetical protein